MPSSHAPAPLATAVARVLLARCRHEWRYDKRGVPATIKLRSMGVREGFPDLILISPGGLLHCLELDCPGGRLTSSQDDFRLWASDHGVPYAIAQSLGEALTAMAAWGCLQQQLPLFQTDITPIRQPGNNWSVDGQAFKTNADAWRYIDLRDGERLST